MAQSKILVVDDERMIRWSIQQALSKDGHSVSAVETGEEAVAQSADEMPDLVFLDITLPGIDGIEVLRRLKELDPTVSVVMVTATEDVKTAVEAMRLGAYDYVSKPFDLDRLRVIAGNALDRHELRQEVEFHRSESARKFGFHRIVGKSRKLLEVLEMARKLGKAGATTVLLRGESGTGKDLVAQAIHYESARASRPFLPINCTALPGELLESELMGHEKGAFTDAKSFKKGLFEVADGGTVFLDEIGDMRGELQAKLLRFIETKSFRRVGGHRDISVDVRIVAATNRNLEELVQSRQFREDLYYRLNVVPLFLPPLRERKEDIPLLLEHYVEEFSREFKRKVRPVPDKVRDRLMSYDWPGNVRELRNLVERVILLEGESEWDPARWTTFLDPARFRSGETPEPGDAGASRTPAPPREEPGVTGLPGESAPGDASGKPYAFRLPGSGIVLESVERDFIVQALQATDGNQSRAAELLGLTRDTLRYRMKKFGLLQS